MVALATTITLSVLFIWRALFPLRKKNCLATLSETKEQQRQFINDVAHELRTPLSLVYGYLQRTLQRSNNLTKSQQQALAIAASETQQIIQLLQELLDLARAENNAMPFEMEKLVLNDAIVDVCKMLEKFDRLKIQLKLPTNKIKVKTDRDRLLQILDRLIKNALQNLNANESINLQLIQCDRWAVIKVSGSAVTCDRSAPSDLFILKRLAIDIGGKLEMQTQSDRGSTIILQLPTLGAEL
jgi:hypothetical protein